MGKNVVVIGTQWGDEGKGKIVDLLTERAAAVARFQGGHNAGHTLVIGGQKTVLPLILASHIVLDKAREAARGANAIGTTGRGIGPAYEDKVARRALRVADLFQRERFAAKLGEILDFHNFVLQHYFREPAVDFQKTLDEQLALGEKIK